MCGGWRTPRAPFDVEGHSRAAAQVLQNGTFSECAGLVGGARIEQATSWLVARQALYQAELPPARPSLGRRSRSVVPSAGPAATEGCPPAARTWSGDARPRVRLWRAVRRPRPARPGPAERGAGALEPELAVGAYDVGGVGRNQGPQPLPQLTVAGGRALPAPRRRPGRSRARHRGHPAAAAHDQVLTGDRRRASRRWSEQESFPLFAQKRVSWPPAVTDRCRHRIRHGRRRRQPVGTSRSLPAAASTIAPAWRRARRALTRSSPLPPVSVARRR